LTFERVDPVGERLNGSRDAVGDTSQQSDVITQCFCLGNRVIDLSPECGSFGVLHAIGAIGFVGQPGKSGVELDDRRIMMMTGGEHSGGDRNLDIGFGGEPGERAFDPLEAFLADAGCSPATEVGYFCLCNRRRTPLDCWSAASPWFPRTRQPLTYGDRPAKDPTTAMSVCAMPGTTLLMGTPSLGFMIEKSIKIG